MARLALVMIVRNEARCIARCLESARHFVDEMIVLDTGSTDETISIAKNMGATVHSMEWPNDFSAARNAALAYSDAEWNLILDADEWIEDGGATLRAYLEAKPFIGLLRVASQFDLGGTVELSEALLPRLLPQGVRYEGVIHEQPVSTYAYKQLPVLIGHDGYRTDNLEQKKGRNEGMLLQALEASPQDAYILHQLGVTCEMYGDYETATFYFEQARTYSKPSDLFRHDLIIRSIVALKATGRTKEALVLCDQEHDNWPNSPDFLFCLGGVYLDYIPLAPERQVELLQLIEHCWKKCIQIGDVSILSGAVKGRGSYLAAEQLAELYRRCQLPAEEQTYRQLAQKMRAAGTAGHA